MLAGRAILWVDKRVSSAEILETRDSTDIAESDWIVLDNETKSVACAWRKVPMESSSSTWNCKGEFQKQGDWISLCIGIGNAYKLILKQKFNSIDCVDNAQMSCSQARSAYRAGRGRIWAYWSDEVFVPSVVVTLINISSKRKNARTTPITCKVLHHWYKLHKMGAAKKKKK